MILSIFNNLLNIFFISFSFLSVLFIVVTILSSACAVRMNIVNLKNKVISLRILKIRLHKLLSLTSLAFIFSLNFILLYYHPILYEWDAINYYIPAAKSIHASGTLYMNVYRQINFLDKSPMIPLLYAYVIQYFDLNSVYVIPAIFYFLTILAVWILAKEILGHDLAILAPLVFLSIPLVQITLGARALYLDVPFYFYLLATLISLIKLTKNVKSYSKEIIIAITSMSSSLMFITRIEIGLFIIFLIVTIILVAMQVRNRILLTFLVLGFPYILREARNILITGRYIDSLIRLIPVFLPLVILFILLWIKPVEKRKINFSFRSFLVFSILLVPPFIFFLVNNVFRGGFIIPGVYLSNDMIKVATMFSKLNPATSTFSYLDLFNWQNMFTVWWTITPFLVPFTVGVFVMLYRFTRCNMLILVKLPLLIIFVSIFILWTQLGCDPQPRRLYLFSIFFVLLITYGFKELRKIYSIDTFMSRVAIYLALSLLTVWNKYSLRSTSDAILLYPKTYNVIIDFELIFYSILSFLIIFFPYEKYVGIEKKKPITRKVLYALFTTFLVLLYLNLSVPTIIEVINSGISSRFKKLHSTYLYPEVVDYYNEKINDSYTTLGIFCHELITFANRSLIDLYDPIFAKAIYLELENVDETKFSNLFESLSIKYLLLPNDNNQFYKFYKNVLSNTSLNMIFNSFRLKPIFKFNYVTLYRYYSNYSLTLVNYSRIIPWNYAHVGGYELVEENNTVKLSAFTNDDGIISIIYAFDSPLALRDCLLLKVKSFRKALLQVRFFTNLKNRTCDYLFFSASTNGREENFLIALSTGQVKGSFNPNHIEGILIAIKTEPSIIETLEVSGLYTVAWND